jgi:hypothetical protein
MLVKLTRHYDAIIVGDKCDSKCPHFEAKYGVRVSSGYYLSHHCKLFDRTITDLTRLPECKEAEK